MQTTSLRYFLAVARSGSIAAASGQLNVAASAISRQIANLEAELGCVLFERRPRGMVPSPAGELLAQHAHQVLVRLRSGRHRDPRTRGAGPRPDPRGLLGGFFPRHPAERGGRFPRRVSRHPLRADDAAARGQVTQVVAAGRGRYRHHLRARTRPAGGGALRRDRRDDRARRPRPSAGGRAGPAAHRPSELPPGAADAGDHPAAGLRRGVPSRGHHGRAGAHRQQPFPRCLPFVRRSRGVALMSALTVQTPLAPERADLAYPIRSRASLARGIQIQAMRGRRLPRAVQAFVRQITVALPPPRNAGS